MSSAAGRGLLVVGGGLAGAAVALHARRLGAPVLLVERERPGSRATGASAGMLAPQFEEEWPTPLSELALRAREAHGGFLARLEELSGASLGHRTPGMLVPAFEPNEDRRAREQAAWQRERGLRAEVVEPDEAAELQPGLAPGALSFLWLPDEAVVDTQALADALPAALAAGGVETVREEAAGLRSRGGSVRGVRLADGRTLDGDQVVVAAGAWSGRLEGLPRPIPVEPARGQMLRYPPGVLRLERLVANRGGRYLVPRPDRSVLAGSTMEAADFEVATTPAGLRAIRLAAERLAPALADAEPDGAWAGLRPSTPDELPVLGADPELEGLFWATGYGRNGILLAPTAGRAVAELALEGESDADLAPFRPDRFGDGG